MNNFVSDIQCARASMETLTLARYILEMTLMDYEIISLRESEVAAASLLVALRMKKAGDWVGWSYTDSFVSCLFLFTKILLIAFKSLQF